MPIRRAPLPLVRRAVDQSPGRPPAEPTSSPALVRTEGSFPPNVDTARPEPAHGLQPNPVPLRLVYGRGPGAAPGSAPRGNNNAGADPGFNPLTIAETFAAFFRPHIMNPPQEPERHGCRMTREITFELTDFFRRKATIRLLTRPPAAPTMKIVERAPAVQLHRVQPTGHQTLLGEVLKADLCTWLEHPTYPVQFRSVSLAINNERIAFLFHDSMWTLTAHEEQRLYAFLGARRRRFTAEGFTRRLHEHNIAARVIDALNPNHLVIYFDAVRSNPKDDLARIREFPEVEATVEALVKSPYIHLIVLSEGDATWSRPSDPQPAISHWQPRNRTDSSY